MGYGYGQLSGRELARDAWSISRKIPTDDIEGCCRAKMLGTGPGNPFHASRGLPWRALAITGCVLCTGTIVG
jgi:hypothetical protein